MGPSRSPDTHWSNGQDDVLVEQSFHAIRPTCSDFLLIHHEPYSNTTYFELVITLTLLHEDSTKIVSVQTGFQKFDLVT